MELEYEEVNGRIRIQKFLTEDKVVAVPEQIEGKTVTGLGRYALSGHGLEELILPSCLRSIGAYALYNCENLKKLSFYSGIEDIGAGVFTGCKSVKELDVTIDWDRKSCLKEVLTELRQTLFVRCHGQQEARLIFPEFYEESVENTPARITGNLTHGCGHRYRYCFSGTQFLFREYDSLFPHVKVQESEELVTELVMGRLNYPAGLTDAHRAAYEAYLTEHIGTAGRIAVQKDSFGDGKLKRLAWLLDHYVSDGGIVSQLAEEAGKFKDTEATSYLMDYRRRRFPEQRSRGRKFEL